MAASFSCKATSNFDLREATMVSFSLTKSSSSSRSSCSFLSLSSLAARVLSSSALTSLSSSLGSDLVLFLFDNAFSLSSKLLLSTEAFFNSFCNQTTSFDRPDNSPSISSTPSLVSTSSSLVFVSSLPCLPASKLL